jgi:hypothetical protein
MITALMILVCGVLLLGWVLAAIAFVASLVSMVPRLIDSRGTSPEDSASPGSRWRAGDRKFLRDVGIRP